MTIDLESICRDAYGNLSHVNGTDLSCEENKELKELWQTQEVEQGRASWDNGPCRQCGEAVCVCHMNLSAWFDLPSELFYEDGTPYDPACLRRDHHSAPPHQGSSYRPQRPEWAR